MKIITEPKLDFKNVLIHPKKTQLFSRSKVDLNRNIVKFPHSKHTWSGVPIIAANMDTVGTFEMYDVLSKHKIITALHKHYIIDDYASFMERETYNPDYFMVSTGITERDYSKMTEIAELMGHQLKWLCVDVANGYMECLVDFTKKMRELFPDVIIVAGNVVSSDMTEELIVNGMVDVVKCGIGGGSACITRLKTGVGMPQLSAIIDCSEKANELGGYVIGDGGITCPGDMAKAFCGGAHFVMCGGVFSGHDESGGELIEENGKKYKLFYGMSSDVAMKKHYGGMAKYRSSEGRVIKVNYRGPLEATVLDYLGGLRSCCTYINSPTISEMCENTTFVLVSQQLNTSLV